MLFNDFFNEIFREYQTVYNTQANYNTNAKSYYDDLAKKNHMIMILSKKIWDYDKELAKRFDEWDKNLEEFDEEVIKLLKSWIDDGTFAHIINEEIFNLKADKADLDYINVTNLGVDNTGQTDIIKVLKETINNNKKYFFPSGEYLIDSFNDFKDIKNVTFSFASNAKWIDSFGIEVELVTSEKSRVPNGIRFSNGENITMNMIQIYNPRDYRGEIAKKDWSKRVPNIDFYKCKNTTITTFIDGYTGPYVTGIYELGSIHMMRASVFRFIECENTDLEGVLNSDSGAGEIYSAFKSPNLKAHDLKHTQGTGQTFWSLGKFIQCPKLIIENIVDIESYSQGSLFDISGSDLTPRNIRPKSYGGYLFDLTKEWGLESGDTKRVFIDGISYNKGVFNTHLPGSPSTDEFKNEIANTITIDDVFISDVFIDGYTASTPFDVRNVKKTYIKNAILKNITRLTYMEKPYPFPQMDTDIYFDVLDLSINSTLKIEAYGTTEIKNSVIEGNGNEIDFVDRRPNNGNLFESNTLIRIENTTIKNATLDISSNIEFINCKYENCIFTNNGLTGKNPNITVINPDIPMKKSDSLLKDKALFNFRYNGVNKLTIKNPMITGEHPHTSEQPVIERRGIGNLSVMEGEVNITNSQSNPFMIFSNADTVNVLIERVKILGLGFSFLSSTVIGNVNVRLKNVSLKQLDNIETIAISDSGNFASIKLFVSKCDFSDNPLEKLALNITQNGGLYTGTFNNVDDWSI